MKPNGLFSHNFDQLSCFRFWLGASTLSYALLPWKQDVGVENSWAPALDYIPLEPWAERPGASEQRWGKGRHPESPPRPSFTLESSDDDNDPDYMDISNDKVKFVKSKSSFKSPTKQRKTFDREFGCDHCNLRFGKRSNMIRHRLKKHDVPMECAVCDKKFTLVEDFEKHNKNDHLQHTCDLCGLKFNTKLALQNHKAAKHEEHIPCPQCGVMFATKYTLASHIGTTHGEFALQKCSECDYSTRNASEMKKHFERKHTENLQETCEFCGSVFKNLKKHLQRTGCGQENFTK